MSITVNVINRTAANAVYHFNSTAFDFSLLSMVRNAHKGAIYSAAMSCSLKDKP